MGTTVTTAPCSAPTTSSTSTPSYGGYSQDSSPSLFDFAPETSGIIA
jgi:hypothetical protein